MRALASSITLAGLLTATACIDSYDGPTLVRTDPAYPAECPDGGSVLRAGQDDDGDGLLDFDEVESETLLCDAAPIPVVTSVAVAAPSATCPGGGVTHAAGVDDDGDGVLDAEEVDTQTLQCGGVIDGDLRVDDADDAARLDGILIVTGSLTITTTEVEKIGVPALRWIGGDLRIVDSPDLVAFDAPALESIGGTVTLRNDGALDHLFVPRLARIEGSLQVGLLPALRGLSLRGLQRVGDDVVIASNAGMIGLDLAALRDAGDVAFTNNGGLVALALRIERPDSRLFVKEMPGLARLDVTCGAAVVVHEAIALESATIACPRAGAHVDLYELPTLREVAITADDLGKVRVWAPALQQLAIIPQHEGVVPQVASLDVRAPIAALPEVRVTGALALAETALTELPCDRLASLTLTDNDKLTRVACDRIDDAITIDDHGSLVEVAIAHPQASRDWIALRRNPLLASAPWLAEVSVAGAVAIFENPALEVPADWALTITAQHVLLADVLGLRRLDLSVADARAVSVLRTSAEEVRLVASGDPASSQLRIHDNAALRTVEVTGALGRLAPLEVIGNPALAALRVDAPKGATTAIIAHNDALPWCVAQGILDQFEAPDELQEGNDDNANVCSE